VTVLVSVLLLQSELQLLSASGLASAYLLDQLPS
jgi:hypothetical protein